MPSIPFCDACFSEVLARVAYQLIVLDYHAHVDAYVDPAAGIGDLYHSLEEAGFRALAFWVLAYQVQVYRRIKLSNVKAAFIQRSRAGSTWRHVAYGPYKLHRRADPRVTNRGVTPRPRRRD